MSELVLNRISGDADFEFGSQMPSFAFAHLVFFRVGRPQKPAQFINKPLAPFPGATSNHSAHGGQSPWAVYEPEITLKTAA